jgi:hypothetical protein
MKTTDWWYRSRFILVLFLLGLYAALWFWLSPGARLTGSEIEDYLGRMETDLPMEAAEKHEFLLRLRHWAEADDGAPVHMLNLIRFHDPMPPVPGFPEFTGTAQEANALYEDVVMPMLARRGIYPIFASTSQKFGDGHKSNLLGFEPELDSWDRVLLVRYPNRRAFLDLASDPTYMTVLPYKLASLDLGFVPLEKQYQVPDPRWAVGLAVIFVVLGFAAIRRARK